MLRYIEVPETVETEIRKFLVMRSKRESLVGDVNDAYDALVAKITDIAEDKAYAKWLDEDMPANINPIALRAQMKHLAEDTIEVYSNKIENETARKLLKLIFEAGDNEFEDDGNAEEED
jgi:hypothetical protein